MNVPSDIGYGMAAAPEAQDYLDALLRLLALNPSGIVQDANHERTRETPWRVSTPMVRVIVIYGRPLDLKNRMAFRHDSPSLSRLR